MKKKVANDYLTVTRKYKVLNVPCNKNVPVIKFE